MVRSQLLRVLLWSSLLALGLSGCNRPGATNAPKPTEIQSASSTEPTPTTTPLKPSVSLRGEPELVFDWSEEACPERTMPDLPVRPFLNADGLINLNLSADINHRLVGEDFDSLAVDCTPTLISDRQPNPSDFNFYEWIGATYTEDGQTIYALIHNEYYGDIGARWDSFRDFSSSQGSSDWSYQGWDGSNYREMEFDQGHDRWQGFRPLCQISNWGMHPDVGCQPALGWTSPISGDVVVFGHVQDAAPDQGDGVVARIFKGNQEVLSQSIDREDPGTHEFELNLELTAGDQLHFRVDPRTESSFDSTQFRVGIDPDGDPCPSGIRENCLMASLTSAVSTDGGRSFRQPSGPDHYVASAPRRYQPDWGHFNIWQPSNIVKNPDDGFYYTLIHRIDAPLDQPGHINAACLMRTDDLADPARWRAWDGEGFNLAFNNPYEIDPGLDRTHCQVVSDQALTYSLTYNSYFEQFIAVGHASGNVTPNGFYYMLSPDLIHWSRPHLLMEAEFAYTTSEGPYLAYPSLVDHDSPARSFDVIGRTPYLYFSRFNRRTFTDADLLRVPLEFSMEE